MEEAGWSTGVTLLRGASTQRHGTLSAGQKPVAANLQSEQVGLVTYRFNELADTHVHNSFPSLSLDAIIEQGVVAA